MTVPTTGGLLTYGADPNDPNGNALRFDMANQGLLGLASGLLQAGGPSLIPHSFGQALGLGLQGLQQGRQQAVQNALGRAQLARAGMENELTASQLPMARARNAMLQQRYPQLFAGAPDSGQPPSSGGPATAAAPTAGGAGLAPMPAVGGTPTASAPSPSSATPSGPWMTPDRYQELQQDVFLGLAPKEALTEAAKTLNSKYYLANDGSWRLRPGADQATASDAIAGKGYVVGQTPGLLGVGDFPSFEAGQAGNVARAQEAAKYPYEAGLRTLSSNLDLRNAILTPREIAPGAVLAPYAGGGALGAGPLPPMPGAPPAPAAPPRPVGMPGAPGPSSTPPAPAPLQPRPMAPGAPAAPPAFAPGAGTQPPPVAPQQPGAPSPAPGAGAPGLAPGGLVRLPSGALMNTTLPPGVNATINTGGEAEAIKPMAEDRAKVYSSLRDAADKATTGMAKLDQLQDQLGRIGPTGPMTPPALGLAAIAEQAGVGDDVIQKYLGNVSAGQSVEKLSRDLLGDIIKTTLPNQRITNMEMQMFEKTVPGLGMRPEANQFLIDNVLRPSFQRSLDRWAVARGVAQNDPGLRTLDDALAGYDQTHPLTIGRTRESSANPTAGSVAITQPAPPGGGAGIPIGSAAPPAPRTLPVPPSLQRSGGQAGNAIPTFTSPADVDAAVKAGKLKPGMAFLTGRTLPSGAAELRYVPGQ